MNQTFENYMLVMAHPGHELRCYGILENVSQVYVLTDGSGSNETPRLEYTKKNFPKKLLPWFDGSLAKYSDKALYELILNKKTEVFCQMIDFLVNRLMTSSINGIIGDALEGYNPAHDLCRYIINAVAILYERRTQKKLSNYFFYLDGRQNITPPLSQEIRIKLDEKTFESKLLSARYYYPLSSEFDTYVDAFGLSFFSEESYHLVSTAELTSSRNFIDQPYYEHYGEKKIQDKTYENKILFEKHMHPIAKELLYYAEHCPL